MCVYSAVGPAFEPLIPLIPNEPWPAKVVPPCLAPALCFCPACMLKMQTQTMPWPWGPVPSTGLPIAPEDLRTLLDAFHAAVAAAKAADKAAGQPDCVDADKVKLEQRVAELERRLDAMAAAAARP
jgi:hypothetical protein